MTTVHQLQLIDEPLPHDDHDFTVYYIITPVPCHQTSALAQDIG